MILKSSAEVSFPYGIALSRFSVPFPSKLTSLELSS